MSEKNFGFLSDLRAVAIEYSADLRRLRGVPDAIRSAWVYPPLPVRQFDWHAFRGSEGLVGLGATEQEAVDDLLMQERTQFRTAAE